MTPDSLVRHPKPDHRVEITHVCTTGVACIDCGTSTFCGFAHGGNHDHSPAAKACTAATPGTK